MGTIIQLSRKAYGLCITAFGIQQLCQGQIAGDFVPPGITPHPIAYVWCVLFILSGVAFFFDKWGYEAALLSGGVFLLCFLLVYLPYLIFFDPQNHAYIEWAGSIETLAFVGASFVFANSYAPRPHFLPWLGKLAPYGRVFFSVMLILYGSYHFVYPVGVSRMVPDWMSGHLFWTYFAGVALIGAGVAIILKFQLRLVASLLGIMIFLWFVLIHIPTAIRDPYSNDGLELARVFVSFGFTGICFLMANPPTLA